ncbi:hypothetical protein EN844_09935 [Mesorhizobium sp. M3A.F.Ca.ET.201.01.1.1]|uniref:hypothetical protein n=1 Tax=Mesorhizobium sp. M3A.F.Ca.ET.201.01.1.1 TaxID=2563946 RepID=UPI001093E50A|nr:hypothetical protein [Mesorhizobium sp. M3A.F.Ca.ET.201.01.1.1]TGS69175.1 hypothetical protein EN844_09935 [Mesorhizobium sp. M3A.F.Ca.ET.201.01.1.1]
MPADKPNILARAWAGLQGTELKLWHMIVAASFSTAITTGVPLWVAHVDKKADQISERSKQLSDTASEFENNVNRVVRSGATFDALKPDVLAALSLNVEQQIKFLNQIRPVLTDDKQKQLADRYARTLIEVRNMLQDGLNAGNTVKFGIAAQELTVTRDQFIAGNS